MTWSDWTATKVEVWQKHTCNSRCKSMVWAVNKRIFSGPGLEICLRPDDLKLVAPRSVHSTGREMLLSGVKCLQNLAVPVE